MFKKFAMLLTPFVIVPLGTLLTPAAAHADFTYFSNANCIYPGGFPAGHDYTPWSATIIQRSSDYAARATRIVFGSNDEYIYKVDFAEYRILNGSTQYFSRQTFNIAPAQKQWKSPNMNSTWISTAGSRHVYVRFYNVDGRICESTAEF